MVIQAQPICPYVYSISTYHIHNVDFLGATRQHYHNNYRINVLWVWVARTHVSSVILSKGVLKLFSHMLSTYSKCNTSYPKNNPSTDDALLLEWETLSNSSFSPILHALHPISTVSTALTIMRKQLSQNRQCPMCMELRMATCGKCATYKRRTRAYHYISQKMEMWNVLQPFSLFKNGFPLDASQYLKRVYLTISVGLPFS